MMGTSPEQEHGGPHPGRPPVHRRGWIPVHHPRGAVPHGAGHRRQERTTPCQKSPAQKELRKLCGGSPPAWVERQVLGLLNRLIQHPERITCPVLEDEPPPEVTKLRRELDELLHRPPVDEAQAKNWPSGWPPSSWTPSGRRSMKPSAFGGCSRATGPWQNWSRNCSMRASDASPSATGRSPSC
ncbi:MAG: hypothetical protein ACLRWQ_07970 [Flavonifractor plautii]